MTTPGAVVGAGAVLMSLVPADEELVAEEFIKNEVVGFVSISADASDPQARR